MWCSFAMITQHNYWIANYFNSVFTPVSSLPSPPLEHPSIPDISGLSIDVNGVVGLMQNLDLAGLDGMQAHFLKPFSAELCT